jgi:energy-coupling factor transport system permease protein
VKRPHPASLILLGLAALSAASSRDGISLLIGTLGLATTALIAATSHLRLLLRRSRWLLLTMLVMFGWFTPGTPLSMLPGSSQEGLQLAMDNLARLLIALSIVALLLRALPAAELVAGIRSLLSPLAWLNVSRDRIAVRLALTLNEVECSRFGVSREPVRMETGLILPAFGFGIADSILGAVTGVLVLGAWLA